MSIETDVRPLVRFRKVRNGGWAGNGFGTASAVYEAILDGEVVGRWDRRGHEVFGRRSVPFCFRYRVWRVEVEEEAQRRHASRANNVLN